jgi:MFS superfamily sulfate permease-like transporter
VGISTEFCVLIGVFMSFLLAVGDRHAPRVRVGDERTVHERQRGDQACSRMLIFGLEGEMYFGSSSSLERHLDTIEERVGPEAQALVLRLKRARNFPGRRTCFSSSPCDRPAPSWRSSTPTAT